MGLLATLRRRDFALLSSGQLISMLGDWVIFIALPFYVYDQTGSALAAGGMFMANVVPKLLVGSVAGVFVDRWNRKLTMVAADSSRAVVLIAVLAAAGLGWLWLIYVLAFLESSISQFFHPAKNSIIPRLVGKDQLIAANSLNSMSENLTRLIGPPLGGALIGLMGLTGVILLDAVSYLLSAALILLIASPMCVENVKGGGESPAPTPLWGEWVAGLKVVRGGRDLEGVFVAMGVASFGLGVINVLMFSFVDKVLGGGAIELSWLLGAQALGGLAGGLIMGQFGRTVDPARLLPLGGLGMGLLILAIIRSPALPFAVGFALLLGFPIMAFFVSCQTLVQMRVDERHRGRVFGALGTTQALTMLAGMGLAAALADVVGIMSMMHLAGIIFLAAGLLAQAMLGRARAPAAAEEEQRARPG